MSDRIRIIAVKKADMDKIDFREPIYWLDTKYMRISKYECRVDSLDKRLNCIINSGKKIVEGERIPCIVKPKTMYNCLNDEKKHIESIKKELMKENCYKGTIENFYNEVCDTIKFIEEIEDDEYLIIRI